MECEQLAIAKRDKVRSDPTSADQWGRILVSLVQIVKQHFVHAMYTLVQGTVIRMQVIAREDHGVPCH